MGFHGRFSKDGKRIAPMIPSFSYRRKFNFFRMKALFDLIVREISFSRYFFREVVENLWQSDKMLVQLTLTLNDFLMI